MPTAVVPTIHALNWRRAVTTNSAATSFASKVPTVTEPVPSPTNGIWDVSGEDVIEVIPFGTDGDNDTFSMRVIGWREHRGAIGNNLWIPNVLCEIAVVLGASTGVASAEVINTEFFADTVSLVANSGEATFFTQTAGNTVAAFRRSIAGYKYIEFTWDLAGAQEATGMNALFTTY